MVSPENEYENILLRELRNKKWKQQQKNLLPYEVQTIGNNIICLDPVQAWNI